MVGRIAAGLVTVGLIGGVGAVTYSDDGTPTVTVKDHGTKSKVTLPMERDGKTYHCPTGTQDKVSPYDVNAGRIKLTLQKVRQQEKAIKKRYPGTRAPKVIADRFNKLARRDDALVDRFNIAVDERNAIISRDCTS
jgi:hypothetical protein